MSKAKCKNCLNFVDRVCSIIEEVRVAGKKRDCKDYNPKPIKQSNIPIFLKPFRTKEQKKIDKQKDMENRARLKEMEKVIEQNKLAEVALIPTHYEEKKIVIKKPNMFKKVFQRIFPK